MATRIRIDKAAGTFAENKDVAKALRVEKILPKLQEREEIILDFRNVTGATQSFVHALFSEIIRQFGPEILFKIHFENCNPVVQEVIITVTEYMQES